MSTSRVRELAGEAIALTFMALGYLIATVLLLITIAGFIATAVYFVGVWTS